MHPKDPVTDAIDLFGRYRIESVLIGGTAAILHGANYTTEDIDFCCSWEKNNLERIADALNAANARLRLQGVPGGKKIDFDAKFLHQYASVAVFTDVGPLDVRKAVDGIGSYLEVLQLANDFETDDNHCIKILSLEGIIRSKRAMNRPQDRMLLPQLETMVETLHLQDGDERAERTQDRDPPGSERTR